MGRISEAWPLAFPALCLAREPVAIPSRTNRSCALLALRQLLPPTPQSSGRPQSPLCSRDLVDRHLVRDVAQRHCRRCACVLFVGQRITMILRTISLTQITRNLTPNPCNLRQTSRWLEIENRKISSIDVLLTITRRFTQRKKAGAWAWNPRIGLSTRTSVTWRRCRPAGHCYDAALRSSPLSPPTS